MSLNILSAINAICDTVNAAAAVVSTTAHAAEKLAQRADLAASASLEEAKVRADAERAALLANIDLIKADAATQMLADNLSHLNKMDEAARARLIASIKNNNGEISLDDLADFF